MGNELLTGFLAGQSEGGGNNGNNGGGFFGNEGLWAVIILAIIFGWGNGNGPGGRNGSNNGGDNVTVVPYPAPSYGMGFGGYGGESVLQRSLDTQTIIGKLDGLNSGLCDGFYAQSNAVSGLGMNVMQGFAQAELAESQRQAALMQQLSNLGYQQKDCCCETQRSIDNVRFTIAQEDCATRNTIQTATRDIIDNQNANYRGIMDYLCQDKIASLQAENQNLKLAASQANQNAAIGAMISASEATILRRTGAECPTAAYVVQPPTPVSFPVNGCGNFAGWNNGWGNNGSCGNGCGSCC